MHKVLAETPESKSKRSAMRNVTVQDIINSVDAVELL